MARNTDETKKIDKFIGTKLTHIICKYDLSRKELAKSINVSVQQLNKYESGMNRISSSRLFLIAKALKKKSTFLYEVLKEYLESCNVNSIGEGNAPEIDISANKVSETMNIKLSGQLDSGAVNNVSDKTEVDKLEYA